jgi:hypothetical protein
MVVEYTLSLLNAHFKDSRVVIFGIVKTSTASRKMGCSISMRPLYLAFKAFDLERARTVFQRNRNVPENYMVHSQTG